MSGSYQHAKTVDGGDYVEEISIYLLDREPPLKLMVLSGWTAEHVTRKVAVKHLGIGSVALEVSK